MIHFFFIEKINDSILFFVLFVVGVTAYLLLVKIRPLRDLVIKSLDQLKIGERSSYSEKYCWKYMILLSSFMSIDKIQNRGDKLGTMSPMDQVLWRTLA